MTQFASKIAAALAVCGFGVAGLVSMLTGSEPLTAVIRGVYAGAGMYFFGALLSYALLHDPKSLPEPPPKTGGQASSKASATAQMDKPKKK